MEAFLKFFEQSGKCTGPAFFTVVLIIFFPESFGESNPLHNFREKNAESLWLALIFLGFLCVAQCGSFIWKYTICPVKKIFFPKKGFGTGIKQSRYRLQATHLRGQESSGVVCYRGVNSNGTNLRYYDPKGKRVLVSETELTLVGPLHVDPGWCRIDWEDVFNGDVSSGTWGMNG